MNSRRFAAAALLALTAAACSGGDGEEQVIREVASTSTPAAVLSEPSSTVAPTTAAPTTTVVVTTSPVAASDAPASLAFASTQDIGRLFEVNGSGAVLDGPAGEIATTLGDGTVVQAAAARKAGDALMVGIVDPLEPSVAIGWIDAEALRPTTQTVLSSDPEIAGQLREIARSAGSATVPVSSTPGGDDDAAILAHREIAMHGGNQAITADGKVWEDVVDPTTRATLGWIPADRWREVLGNSARTNENLDAPRTPSSERRYGAQLPNGVVVAGCNATQIRFDNSSESTGMAFVFGTTIPVAVEQASGSTVWQSTGGATLYVEPGASVTVTVKTDQARSWFFAGLDSSMSTASEPSAYGLPRATDYQEFALPSRVCRNDVRPPVVSGVTPAGSASESGSSTSVSGTEGSSALDGEPSGGEGADQERESVETFESSEPAPLEDEGELDEFGFPLEYDE